MNNTIINFDAIEQAEITQSPFPFFGLDCVFSESAHQDLLESFPAIEKGGSFPLDHLELTGRFAELIEEIQSDRFREVMAKKFNVELKDKPQIITTRGWSRQKDGRNHTDSKTKLITVLLYVNDGWEPETGRLRMLNSDDVNDYVAEFSCNIGQLTAFKVTDNCWHGYLPFEGRRQSLQINYLVEERFTNHHVYRHKLSAFLRSYSNKLLCMY